MIEVVLNAIVTREAMTALAAGAAVWNLTGILVGKKFAALSEPLKTIGPLMGVVTGTRLLERSRDTFWEAISACCIASTVMEVCVNICEGGEVAQATKFWLATGVTAYNAYHLW